MMMTWDKMERPKRDTAELVLSNNHLAIVLSLILSLAIVAISSKNHILNSLWFDLAAFAFPIPIVLYFQKRIVRFGIFTCVAAIVLPLGAAVLFGI